MGGGVDRGTLQPQTFEALGVTGAAFVTVDSDCDWAIALERAPDRSPSPIGRRGRLMRAATAELSRRPVG